MARYQLVVAVPIIPRVTCELTKIWSSQGVMYMGLPSIDISFVWKGQYE